MFKACIRAFNDLEGGQGDVMIGHPQVMGRMLGPGAGIDVADPVGDAVFGKVGVPAHNGIVSLFPGAENRIFHDIVAEDLVESFPFLGIMRHVYGPCTQCDPRLVQKFEPAHKETIPGHDLIKIVTMGNQETIVDLINGSEFNISDGVGNKSIVMISLYPYDMLAKGQPLDAIDNSLMGQRKFCFGVVENIPVEDECAVIGNRFKKPFKFRD